MGREWLEVRLAAKPGAGSAIHSVPLSKSNCSWFSLFYYPYPSAISTNQNLYAQSLIYMLTGMTTL